MSWGSDHFYITSTTQDDAIWFEPVGPFAEDIYGDDPSTWPIDPVAMTGDTGGKVLLANDLYSMYTTSVAVGIAYVDDAHSDPGIYELSVSYEMSRCLEPLEDVILSGTCTPPDAPDAVLTIPVHLTLTE